jgi:hypothetical protein
MKFDLDEIRDCCLFEGTADDTEATDFIAKMLQADSASELIEMSKSALNKAEKEDAWKDVAWLFLRNENTPESVLSDLVQIAADIQAQIFGGDDFEYVRLIAHPNNSSSSLSTASKFIVSQIMGQSLPLTALFASTKLNSESLDMLCKECSVEKVLDAFLVLSHPNSTEFSKDAASWFEGTVVDIDSEELVEHDFLLKYGFDIPVELKKRFKNI